VAVRSVASMNIIRHISKIKSSSSVTLMVATGTRETKTTLILRLMRQLRITSSKTMMTSKKYQVMAMVKTSMTTFKRIISRGLSWTD